MRPQSAFLVAYHNAKISFILEKLKELQSGFKLSTYKESFKRISFFQYAAVSR